MEERCSKRDQWGYEISSSSDSCISSINSYHHQIMIFGRERCVIMKATESDNDCVLANILAASFLASSDPSKAPLHLQAAISKLEQATSYEKSVFELVNYFMSDNRDDDVALDLHSKIEDKTDTNMITLAWAAIMHLKDFPKDLTSLYRALILCVSIGRPDLSLDLVQQVLPHNQDESYIYGMFAFPLLELGRMEEAEKAAKKALEINKNDCWAQHNICHVLQHNCRFKEAVEFMEACSSTWAPLSSFMITHHWWHIALCYLEGHSPMQTIVEVYDQHLWKELEKPDSVAPEVYLNCLGLLLRLYVRGKLNVFQDRLKVLTDCITDKRYWYIGWHFDVLILWALAYGNEASKAEELLAGLKSRVSKMSNKKQQCMQRGLLLAEAMYEYGKGNDKQALELLSPNFDAFDYKIIGASDEQIDVFNDVWYSVLLNTGEATKAIEAIKKSVKKREGVPFLWRLLERAYKLVGREGEATIASDKARVLEGLYF